jgi:hypothetical protein
VGTLSVFHEIQARSLNISYLKFLFRSVRFKTWFYPSEGSVVNGEIQLAAAGVAALPVTTVAFIWSILYLAQIPPQSTNSHAATSALLLTRNKDLRKCVVVFSDVSIRTKFHENPSLCLNISRDSL